MAGDFNGDGRLDLATGNVCSSDISVLLGKGDGSFEEPPANAVGNYPAAIATGDFTGNGNLGVAVVNQGSDSVTILPGNGDGTFQRPLTVALPQGSGASSIVAADFNNDGRTDLAVTDQTSTRSPSSWATATARSSPGSTIAVPGGPYAIAAGDFTGNGQVDLAVADRSSSSVTILLGNGDGTFIVGQTIALVNPDDPTNPFLFPDAIVAGNFTSSGHLDLAVAEPFTDQITVLLGTGNGTFHPGLHDLARRVVPPNLALVAGDFRNNGLTDLAVASTDSFNGDSLDVLLGNGDGTFQAPRVAAISLGSGVYPAGDRRGRLHQ